MRESGVRWGAQPSTKTIASPASSIISRKVSQHYDPARAQKVADCREELAVKLPSPVVCPQMEGPVVEKRRVADDQAPPLLDRDRRQIVGMIDCNPPAQSVIRDRAPAGPHRHRVNIRQAERLAQPMAEHREANESRSGAPFEHPRLPGHATVPQKGDHLLAKGAAAPVEPVLVMHSDTAIGRDMPRLEATVQPALELTAGPRKRTGFLCQRSTPPSRSFNRYSTFLWFVRPASPSRTSQATIIRARSPGGLGPRLNWERASTPTMIEEI